MAQGMITIISPPFEGGVDGTADYQFLTKFISRPGWLILEHYNKIHKDENRYK